MADPNSPTSETPGGSAAATAAPAKPAMPAKPAPPPKAPAKKTGDTRRFFLLTWFGSWFAVGWTTFTAAMAGMVLWTLRFLSPNVNSDPPATFKAGKPDDYASGEVVAYKDQGTWIVRARDDKGRDILYALSTTCTHLGCTPNWLDDAKKFKCPCHGSGFYITGVNFEGPAPRPLERWAVKRGEDGRVFVDKRQKFQKELGQWENPDSFILMS
jgi:cytochrome b6-f complex iron-sulfur subunit